MTNFEKITASPEKLLEALRDEHGDLYPITVCSICSGCEAAEENCEKGVLDWLKQEAGK